MQILHGFITPAILAFFLSTTLAAPPATSTSAKPYTSTKSVPACAASAKPLRDLQYEFWIQVVFDRPFNNPFSGRRPDYPLHIERDKMAYAGVSYNALLITQTYQIRELFLLRGRNLYNRDGDTASLLPDEESDGYSTPGYNPVLFGFPSIEGLPIGLDFTAVKVCTPDLDTELQLRAQRYEGDGSMFFFQPSPSCGC